MVPEADQGLTAKPDHLLEVMENVPHHAENEGVICD
jgi:hypothetical protein